ncbi:MAG: hypothetical protein NZ927_08490 [Candidatus Calescibacterium sp.]|nr:hypothetical protein [Candidatus Calescibacterium sp.]MCX7734114.1 hypothetical protein [bacterium]MDW8088040.1 hypothetical protein [Candidatus Calescibacterium sp.]
MKLILYSLVIFILPLTLISLERKKDRDFLYLICKNQNAIYFVGRDSVLYSIGDENGDLIWKTSLLDSWKEAFFLNPPICTEKRIFVLAEALSGVMVYSVDSDGKILWQKYIDQYRTHKYINDLIFILGDNQFYLIDKNGVVSTYTLNNDFSSFHSERYGKILLITHIQYGETQKKYKKVGFNVFDIDSRSLEYREISFDKDFYSFLYNFPDLWVVFNDEIAGFDKEGQKIFSFQITNQSGVEQQYEISGKHNDYLVVSARYYISDRKGFTTWAKVFVFDTTKSTHCEIENLSFGQIFYGRGNYVSDGNSVIDLGSCKVKFTDYKSHFFDGEYIYFFDPSLMLSVERSMSFCLFEQYVPAAYYPEKLIKLNVEGEEIWSLQLYKIR